VVVAVWGILVANRTLKNIVRQANAAEKQIAKLDEGLAETRKAAATVSAQAEAAREQAEIARTLFVLTQRPRLVARNVVIAMPRPPAIIDEIPIFEPRHEISGTLYVMNIGGTVATTKECWCWGISMQGELPMERPYEHEVGIPLEYRLRPGETLMVPFRNLKEIGDEGPLIRQDTNKWSFYVMGWISYADDLGLVRKTAFCRKWDAVKRRLLPVPDPDYEHED
jgi:hypothetical protein